MNKESVIWRTELKISLCKLNYKYDETCCLSFLLNNRESLFQLFKQKVYFYRYMFVTDYHYY